MQVFDRSWAAKASRNLLKNDHLTAWLGRINQFHLGCPIDQDGALIDVCLIRDLASRQRGCWLKSRSPLQSYHLRDSVASVARPLSLISFAIFHEYTVSAVYTLRRLCWRTLYRGAGIALESLPFMVRGPLVAAALT